MSRWFAPLLALSSSFVLLMVFAPQFASLQQYDFWLLLLGLQLLISIPMLSIELALAKRSQSTPLQGMLLLTREADVSTRWRILPWGGVVVLALLASAVLYMGSTLLQQHLALNIHPSWVFATLAVLSLGLSIAPRILLIGMSALLVVAMTLLTILVILQEQPTHSTTVTFWQWTTLTASEWGRAVVLLSIYSLLGVGAYWQLRVTQPQHNQAQGYSQSAPSNHLKFMVAMVLSQLLALGFAAITLNHIMQVMWLLLPLSVVFAALLWQLLNEQLQQRQVSMLLRAAILLLPLLAWSQTAFYSVMLATTAGLVLLLATGYAIFAGWRVKISHLRKALNFSHEGVYNVWRVLLRIVLPIILMSGFIRLVMGWR